MCALTKRGAGTRKALLDTATKLFSERGFDGVSTRDIAQTIGITLPSILHFFGSKQGLYEAVLAEIAGGLEEKLQSASAEALATARKRSSRGERLEALDHLVSTLTRSLLNNPTEWTRLLLQEQLHASEAGALMNELISDHLMVPLSHLIAALRGIPVESTQVRLEVLTLLGGIVVFRTNRVSPFRVLNTQTYSAQDVERIVEIQRGHIHAIFGQRAERNGRKRAAAPRKSKSRAGISVAGRRLRTG